MMHRTIIIACWVFGSVTCATQVISSDSIIVATPVTAVITSECQWAVDVVSSADFEPGDRVLLHQAKGALCAQDQPLDSGSVLSVGNAGAFAFNWVRGIVRNRILLSDSISVPFDVNHGVQIVKVLRGTNLRIGATIQPRPWDGASGGVVAIEASSSIVFGPSRIDAMGRGFRGGDMSGDMTTCTPGTEMHAAAPSLYYGSKGEGIALPRTGAEAGRASLANGGGGGGNHNSGGGMPGQVDAGVCTGAAVRGWRIPMDSVAIARSWTPPIHVCGSVVAVVARIKTKPGLARPAHPAAERS